MPTASLKQKSITKHHINWEYSKKYPNVIIVKSWRENKMNEDQIKAQLYPTWRKWALTAHSALTRAGNFVAWPFVWVSEQFNGTAEFRTTLKRMEEDEKRTAEVDTLKP